MLKLFWFMSTNCLLIFAKMKSLPLQCLVGDLILWSWLIFHQNSVENANFCRLIVWKNKNILHSVARDGLWWNKSKPDQNAIST